MQLAIEKRRYWQLKCRQLGRNYRQSRSKNPLREARKLTQYTESLKSEKQGSETIHRLLEEYFPLRKTESLKISLDESKQEKAQLLEQLQSALQALNSGKSVDENPSEASSIELQQLKIELKFKSQQLADLESKHKKAKIARESVL